MRHGVWGKKLGMAQGFYDNEVVPVTAINIEHWLVTDKKNRERDGYQAVQVGLVKNRYIDQSFSNNWLKNKQQFFAVLKEIKVDDDIFAAMSIGKSANVHVQLEKGDKVDVTGTSKGIGFAGVYKRHGFGGAPKSHGSRMGRKPGSIGFMTACGKVIKGKKLPGHKGNSRVVMQGLEIVELLQDQGVVLVKGSVAGKVGSIVFISKNRNIGKS